MYKSGSNAIEILIAEDDADDRLLIKEALRLSLLKNKLQFIENGEQLLDYLYNRGEFADVSLFPLPGLILLDLNMPKKDGREVLNEIKQDSRLKSIPVVILTSSKAEEDIARSYHLGVNSFITKPVSFEGLVDVMKIINKYWFEIVEIP